MARSARPLRSLLRTIALLWAVAAFTAACQRDYSFLEAGAPVIDGGDGGRDAAATGQ